VAAPPAGPYRRPFLMALGYVPMATYVAAAGPLASDVFFPRERFVMAQIVGGGYVVNPRFRFGMVGIFNEAFTGLPPEAATWQFGGVAPVAISTLQQFIIGGGPIIGYRRRSPPIERRCGRTDRRIDSRSERSGGEPRGARDGVVHTPLHRVGRYRCRDRKGVLIKITECEIGLPDKSQGATRYCHVFAGNCVRRHDHRLGTSRRSGEAFYIDVKEDGRRVAN
jgi:hypothetical protein